MPNFLLFIRCLALGHLWAKSRSRENYHTCQRCGIRRKSATP
mgnify:CR=1 FL=1